MYYAKKHADAFCSFENLSPENEILLFKRYKEEGCLAARDQIIKAYLKLVIATASKASRGDQDVYEELIGECNIVLFKAIDGFDITKNVCFATYARFRLKEAVLSYLMDSHKIIKTATTKEYRKLFFAIHNIEVMGEHPTEAEFEAFAKKKGVSLKSVKDMYERRYAGNTISYNFISNDNEAVNDEMTFQIDDYSDFALVLSEFSQFSYQTNLLAEFITKLDDREVAIIKGRYLDAAKKSLSEFAALFSISNERVRQIEKKALMKLKGMFSDVLSVDELFVPIVA